MTTYRTNKESGKYMILDKTAVEDPNLSLKAKGLHAYMMSKADNWQFYETEIVKNCKDGRDSVRSGIDELVKAGYIVRNRQRDDKGRLGGYDYDVYETPVQSGKTNVGKTNVGESNNGKTYIGKPDTNNNKSNNNNLNNNNSTNNDLNDMNDKEDVEITNHSNHTNHLPAKQHDFTEDEKEVMTQNLPPVLASYLMNFDIDEIRSIKSTLLKSKAKFYSQVEVDERLTIEDVETDLIQLLKRVNVKRKSSGESIRSLEAYLFSSFVKVFHSNVIFSEEDITIDVDENDVNLFFNRDMASGY
ncbi:helix-turn-helix domain-containing protein [Macrococcus equipercicus]|uniref:Helix-turn-helix domain-containing protein n=1 Tax=Macrococcus equipercicus TaxID=69967 RepID=A0ABQ6R7S6_9STAP|nr:helix-turn-helix domain-containing protein [Macrococcus equipercicus]KAA1039146.1 helix-turn-helix domain-containing protein [Macrococcus equipercicus]